MQKEGLGSKEMSKRVSKRNIRSITDSDEEEDDEQGREEECLERGRTQLEKYGVEDIADICSDWRDEAQFAAQGRAQRRERFAEVEQEARRQATGKSTLPHFLRRNWVQMDEIDRLMCV